MNARWKYCKHCDHCLIQSRKKAVFQCWANRFADDMFQKVCPIYTAETHEEALAALVLRRLENGT